MMKTILVVLGLTAVLFSGVLSQESPSSCTDDDDCGMFGQCNTTTSMCECYPGFTGTPCEDIDECLDDPCDDMATCYNFNGSYFCVCSVGYSGNGSYCEDINECELFYGICGQPDINQCINLDGNYTCNCNIEYGFYYDPNNRTCISDETVPDLPVELHATIIDDRDGCYPGDIDHYIEHVKNETLEILREIIVRLGFHSEN